jgi:predicted acyl esterase
MRQVHDAAEHDRWFREQVEEAVRQADSGETEWIDEDEWKRRTDQRRAVLESRAGSR